MIAISNLTKSYNDQIILNNISIEIKEGEILAILGESGTGKSVLLKHMIGLIKPDKGTIQIDADEITCLSESALLKVRQKIGYLFQEGALYDFMSVFENISFPLKEHTSLRSSVIQKKVQDVLELIDLKDVEQKYPSQLSGGMKKRVALARAIILDSKILFCDEPTSGLDPIRSRGISDLIKNVSKRLNCTTVITSHDIDNSFRIADRLVILNNGQVVKVGTKEDMLSSENKYIKKFLN